MKSSKMKNFNRVVRSSDSELSNLQCIVMRLEIIETNSMKTKLSANNNFAIFLSGNICYSDQFRFINNISNNNQCEIGEKRFILKYACNIKN